MIEVRISELPPAGPITGSELVEIVQGGKNKRARASAISSDKLVRQAGATISALTVVWEDVDGKVRPADYRNDIHVLMLLGITTNAAQGGGSVSVQRTWHIDDASWAWIPQQKVWLGAGGALTQTPPVQGGYDVSVGVALSPTRLLVQVGEPIELLD